MVASFTVIPLGVEGGVKHLVAEAIKIVDESGLPYRLGAMSTTVEGEREEVIRVILACHTRLLELCPRVMTQISMDERKGYTKRLEGKVTDVEEVLGKKLRRE